MKPLTHSEFSSKGGKAGTGKSKARTKKQCRAAALKRWRKSTASELIKNNRK